MSDERTIIQSLSSTPMHTVWRYLGAAIFSGLAMGWYAYSELSNELIFAAERLGKAVQAGITFGVFFGLVVLVAAEVPERLRGIWPWWVCFVISVNLGFMAGLLLWSVYAVVFLYSPIALDQLDSAVVGGIFTALAFSLGVVSRIPGWLAAVWSALMIYLALFITWSNQMPLIYTRPDTPAQPAEHINQYAIVIALQIGIGAYAPGIFAEVRLHWRRPTSATVRPVLWQRPASAAVRPVGHSYGGPMNILRFSHMSTDELVRLFSVTLDAAPLSDRAVKLINELEKRGYLFDPRHRDFITCDQWNVRHGNYTPMDCHHWAKDA